MNILGIVGSLRKNSYNRTLFRIVSRHIATLGSTVTEAEIGDIPLYNEDVELAGWPAPAQRFFNQVQAADAIVIVSPEYNYSIPGGLKNAIDWASTGANAWKDKIVALCGVSIGQYGTTKMQMHLRQVLIGTGVAWVIPQPQVAIGPAAAAFQENGELIDAKMDDRVQQLMRNLIDTVQKLSV